MANRDNSEFSYEIIEHIAVLSASKVGWSKELNLVSWNGANAKYDIREWDEKHERMSRGVTFSEEEAISLRDALDERLK